MSDSLIDILPEDLADTAEREVKTATVSATDSWGTTTHYEIEWRPEVVRGVMLGHENIGEVPIVWLNEPPVSVCVSARTGSFYLKTWPVQVTGQRQRVVEGVRVDAEDELQPGTYRVLREWDGVDE